MPTMGNLHEGTSTSFAKPPVVRRGGREHFRQPPAVRSQRGSGCLPRTWRPTRKNCSARGAGAVYPTVEEITPRAWPHTRVAVPDLSETPVRQQPPRSFRRVTTVVAKLFNIVRPDTAVFGEKDFQQLSIVRKMVKDLCMPVNVVGVATTVTEDGLAMSSRNGYLSAEQRHVAPVIHQT